MSSLEAVKLLAYAKHSFPQTYRIVIKELYEKPKID